MEPRWIGPFLHSLLFALNVLGLAIAASRLMLGVWRAVKVRRVRC